MRGFGAALLVGALLLTAGCGGDDKPDAKKPAASKSAAADEGSRPSVKQISQALQSVTQSGTDDTYTAKQATCIASILESSKVSNAGLREAITNPGEFNPTGADAEAVQGLIPQISACLIDELRKPTPTS